MRPLPNFPPSFRAFLIAVVALSAAFGLPLWRAARLASESSLYSHILLVPAICLWLMWLERDQFLVAAPAAARPFSLAPAVGTILLLLWSSSLLAPAPGQLQDRVALELLAYVLAVGAAALFFLGPSALRAAAFPLIFLVFLAPFPIAVENAFETFLQRNSALAANGFFELAGTTVFRDGTYFRLPGFSMQVAPECSGIHSTLALFLTSLLAGKVLLRSPGRRALLALVVLPIALIRNGFRVFTIGELCVRIGPHMIDSYIHRHGGPIFFLLSLIPFSFIMLALIRSERRGAKHP